MAGSHVVEPALQHLVAPGGHALDRRLDMDRRLLAFQDEVGQFGTLLYAGKDWKDRELGRQSMILMAEKVMPQINAGTSNDSSARTNRISSVDATAGNASRKVMRHIVRPRPAPHISDDSSSEGSMPRKAADISRNAMVE